MRRFFRKVVDERQEQEMVKVERIGFWILYYSIFAVMLIQMFFFNVYFTDLIGLFIVGCIGAICIIFGYYRKGLWGYSSNPGLKSYIITSISVGVVSIILLFVVHYFYLDSSVFNSLLMFAFISLIMAISTFLFASLYGTAIKRRRMKLQQQYKDESDM